MHEVLTLSTARAVPVLMYHHVSPAAGAVTVSPVHFADQMAMLAREGYTTLGARAFSEYLAGKPVPAKSVVLTFDDGYLDNWVHAHPVLAEYGFTALGFLVSGWVNSGPVRPNAMDSTSAANLPDLLGHSAAKAAIEAGETDRAIMRWSEIDAMRQAGTFEFHSHTHTHTRWDRVSADASTKRASLRDDLLTGTGGTRASPWGRIGSSLLAARLFRYRLRRRSARGGFSPSIHR